MSSSREVREYVLAGLLHDVGKLIRRARLCRGESAKRHVEHSVEFVEQMGGLFRRIGLDVNLIVNLIRHHHDPKGGLAPYDRSAAAERTHFGEEESGSRLCMEGRGEHQIPFLLYTGDLYVPPYPLPRDFEEARRMVPSRDVKSETVCEAYLSAEERLRLITNRLLAGGRFDYERLVEALDYALRSAASFVPAAVYGVSRPESSLYVHLKLTAAFASTGGEFYLLGFDVAKIQEYITKAQVVKNAMSIMRGRSLRVAVAQKIVQKYVADYINEKLGAQVVTSVNTLLDTGGEVLMIIPKIGDLDHLVKSVMRRSLRDSKGHFRINAAYVGPLTLDDAKSRWPKLVEDLEGALAEAKFEYFDYSEGGSPTTDYCDFCGWPAASQKLEEVKIGGEKFVYCKTCAEDFYVGKAARNLRAVALMRGDAPVLAKVGGCEVGGFSFLGWSAVFYGGEGCNPSVVPGDYVYFVNNPVDFASGGVGFIYTNSYMPSEAGEVKSLEALGDIAFYVKLDANKMGELKARASQTPSGLLTFSLAVSAAYELYPNLLASRGRYREEIFVVFAGGDDAYYVGSPAALAYLADVVDYAHKWGFKTAAGAYFTSPYTPIYYAFEEISSRVDAAKRISRDENIVVFATSPIQLHLPIEELKSFKHIDTSAVEKRSFLFKVGLRLAELIRAVDRRDRREILRTLINLAYMWNRRDEDDRYILREVVGGDLSPGGLKTLFAPCLTQQQLRGGQDPCQEARRRVTTWLARLYLTLQLSKQPST